MGNLKDSKKIWHIIGLCFLVLTILSLVITVTINAYPLYVWEVHHSNLAQGLGLTETQLLHNYQEMMAYLNFPWRTTFALPNLIFSESGAFHFFEVKRLFMLNYSVLAVTIIPSFLFIRHLIKTGGMWRLVRPFQMLALAPIFLGLLMLMSFDWFFINFHSLFFNNDAWLFDPVADPIINALPESYFMKCFILGFLLFEILSLVIIYYGKKKD